MIFVHIIASLITIANFIYAIYAFSVHQEVGPLTLNIALTPGVSFILFFMLEVICSYFIIRTIISLFDRTPQTIDIFSLFFGIINVGNTLFNYRFLFDVKEMKTEFDVLVFLMFIAGGFLIDIVVMNSISRAYNLSYMLYGVRFDRRERLRFIFIQGVEYFLMALFIITVSRAI